MEFRWTSILITCLYREFHPAKSRFDSIKSVSQVWTCAFHFSQLPLKEVLPLLCAFERWDNQAFFIIDFTGVLLSWALKDERWTTVGERALHHKLFFCNFREEIYTLLNIDEKKTLQSWWKLVLYRKFKVEESHRRTYYQELEQKIWRELLKCFYWSETFCNYSNLMMK